jgi:hypothetical protein
MIKKNYWYYDEDKELISSKKIPDTKYVEQIINTIGVPSVRVISLKSDKGETFYNGAFTVPTASNDDIIKEYLGDPE